MTEHDTTDHVGSHFAEGNAHALAIQRVAQKWLMKQHLSYSDMRLIYDNAEILAARLAAAEAERDAERPEVWAVVELDYDDYPVGAPLSYHWTEQSAKGWARQHGPRHLARRVVVRTISINGDLPATDGSDDDA